MVTSTPAVLSVRVSHCERTLLEAAAKQARTNLSDFIRRKAIEAAETELLNRRVVKTSVENWGKVERWVYSPAKTVPELRCLASTRNAWDDRVS